MCAFYHHTVCHLLELQIASSIDIFLSDMLLHPEIQKKIHAELDAVIARGHLPTFEDRANLPYLDAAWRESIRHHPPSPISMF